MEHETPGETFVVQHLETALSERLQAIRESPLCKELALDTSPLCVHRAAEAALKALRQKPPK